MVAVGTFVYLEVVDLASGVIAADSVQGFVMSELVTFFIESFFNTLWASAWPFYWFFQHGWLGLGIFFGGYLIWTMALAAALDRREKAMRRELGL